MEFGEIVLARILTTEELGKLDLVWAGKAEGSDEHIGLDHRGARRFRAVRHEREKQQAEARSDARGCWRPLGHEARRSHLTV